MTAKKELKKLCVLSGLSKCHVYELRKHGRKILTEVAFPIVYDGQKIDAGYRLDMVVDDLILVENKTVETILSIHTV